MEDNQKIKFYDLKTRAHVEIPVAEVVKTEMKRETKTGEQTRYALKAQSEGGTSLTKFVNKETYESFTTMAVVESAPKEAKPKKGK